MPSLSLQSHSLLSYSVASTPFARQAGPVVVPVPPASTSDVFDGTSGDDNLTGTDGDDAFNLEAGGHDIASGLAGNDVFNFGAAFESADHVFGGGGYDTLVLDGTGYNVGSFVITSDMLHNVEEIRLAGAHPYSFRLTGTQSTKKTTIDAADTTHLTIDSEGAHDSRVHVFGSAFQDFISVGDGPTRVEAGDGNDQVRLALHGRLKLDAGNGDDWVVGSSFLLTDDRLEGGPGTDYLSLGYTDIALTDRTVTGFEVFRFWGGAKPSMVTADGTVGAGDTLIVDGESLTRRGWLRFDGSAETDGHFAMTGSDNHDVLTGGAVGDQIAGGGNRDMIVGGGGADTLDAGLDRDGFGYAGVADSTGAMRDVILNLEATQDNFVLPVAVTGVDEAIAVGALNEASFDADLETAVDATNLDTGFAVVFTASDGDLSGHLFLVIDANGTAGYQTGADFVIELVDPDDLDQLSADNFI